MRTLRIIILAAVSSLLISCGPPWTVIVKSGPPSALAGVQQFSVAADRSQMMISSNRTLDAEVAARDPEDGQALLAAVAAMESSFATGFASQGGVPTIPATADPQPNEARVTIRWLYLDPGKYAFVYARDTDVRARVVFTVGASVVDEIEIRRVVDANSRQGSIQERVNIAGEQIGRLAGKYVRNAQSGG
jgi:hypothetical protein